MTRLLPAVVLLVAVGAAAVERTEQREPCAAANPLRSPFFGDLHVHTALSFDAWGQGTRTRPSDAYRFAMGEPMGFPPYDDRGDPASTARLHRPLDFAAVTDHSDLLGEVTLCSNDSTPESGSLICTIMRRWPRLGYILVNGYLYSAATPHRYSFCGPEGTVCRAAADGPWREIRDAAEESYDRTSACRFTTFVAYEWTSMPDGANLHRNVIFRNATVQEHPTTYIETPTPQGLWAALRAECTERGHGCEVMAIPHNSNVSNGLMFQPVDPADAPVRAALERLVEVTQHKGDSECGLLSSDEECGFEKLPYAIMADSAQPSKWRPAPPGSFVRGGLGLGLVERRRLGVNPMQLGLIGSTDTHFSAAGRVEEDEHMGHGAGLVFAAHGIPPFPDQPENNPGGLAVIWAEENSRDALFEAMKRREVYATSGPRIVVRVFGGWDLPADICGRGDFVEAGYARGVPMGAELPPAPPGGVPTFAISALRDPGSPGRPGAPLERLQVVKLWEDDGQAHEQVFDVAGAAVPAAASVNAATCAVRPAGRDSVCAVWRDPTFDRVRHAAYYVRVLEQPSCRWSTWACLRNQADCGRPETATGSLAACCDPALPKTIRERAWTSPIWYVP